MKIQHLGKLIEIDPTQAAWENRIIRMLARKGPMLRGELWRWTSNNGRFFNREQFEDTIQRLASGDEPMLLLSSTLHAGSFLVSLTEWGKLQGEALWHPDEEQEEQPKRKGRKRA